MTKQTTTGLLLFAVALFMGVYNTLDRVAELKEWHGVWEPSVIGPMIKSFMAPAVGFMSGLLLPSPKGDN